MLLGSVKYKKTNRSLTIPGRFLLLCFIGIITTPSCKQQETPKPVAYPRLTYPHTGYIKADSLPYPISFDYPSFASLEIPTGIEKEKKWINIRFNKFQSVLYTSYFQESEKTIHQRLLKNESVLNEQIPPYSHIRKQEFDSKDGLIKGYLYEIDGNTACPLQFVLTDKHQQMFRGALYFKSVPNRDSIAAIIDGLTTDVRFLMENFKFKK
jgi:gliding motility-associated lipoprotein GldD